ncbi:LLM class flavin-dependent oxidoreductase [Marinicellulosiphila megalodicopiae]|uniref:LLM class flavin-dependent oxidoreductase n=1 Tax=Marinicellulosiphila megalodicopiae TaxID=2724896 RepID=UPI003BAFF829
MIPFSILDLAPITQGNTVADSLDMSRKMAIAAEKHNYLRFWLAEHHGMKGVASSATSVLLANIGAATSKIRIGSGGVMLPNHSALVIAEQFGTLAQLYPNRVDLGLGRAPGTDSKTALALRRNMQTGAENYPNDVLELQSYLANGVDSIEAVPGNQTFVPLWLLGSSLYSAKLAAQFGLPYSFASHFAPDQLMQALQTYRADFKPSVQLQTSHSMAGIMAVVADTDAEAQYLFTSVQQQFVNMFRNVNQAFAHPVDSMNGIWSAGEKHHIEHMLQYAIVGSKKTVAFQLSRFIKATEIDELIVSMPIYDADARLKSLKLMAQVRDEMVG